MNKIVVFGATGFVGAFICKELTWAGYNIVSVSKSGGNKYLSDAETMHIKFIKSEISDEDNWKYELNDSIAVINCIGILFQKKNKDNSYRQLLYETTMAIANAAKEKKVKNFIQLSADNTPSFILREYHIYKRRSEIFLLNQKLRLLIIKPHIIVSPRRPLLMLFYRLQDIFPFYFRQFEPIENIAQQTLQFLEKI